MDNEEIFQNGLDLIEEKIIQLCEDLELYCDSVFVICTKHNKKTNQTHSIRTSRGNVDANAAVIREWLKQQEQLALKEDTEDES